MLNNFSVKITILVFLVILIVLVGLTFLAQRTQQTTTAALTPTPTQSPRLPAGSTQHSFMTARSRFPTDRQARFDAFIKKLPHSSRDFDAEYVPQLNAVVIYIKTPTSTNALKAYLNGHNVLDIYLSGSMAIISSTKPIETTKNELLNEDTFEGDEEGVVQGVTTSENPWLKNLPIEKPMYTISFDSLTSTIMVEYKTSNADTPATEAEIRSTLELAGVPLNTYPVTYVTLE